MGAAKSFLTSTVCYFTLSEKPEGLLQKSNDSLIEACNITLVS